MRTLDIVYRVLRGGAFYGILRAPADGGRKIRMSDSAEIKMSLSGSFSPVVEDIDGRRLEPDWLSDEIQPVMVVDGAEHPLGIYAPATVTPSETNGIEALRIEAYDRCWRVRDTRAESRLSFAAGTNYITAVKQLLAACGVSVVIATATSATFPQIREDWEIGTSYLAIINELLAEISYKGLYFTEDGAAMLEPASVPSAENIEHVLSDEPDPGEIKIDRMLPSISRTTDIYKAPNVFLCVCSNADKSGALTATAVNSNPQSPLSTMRRGRRIVKVTRVNNVASQTELQTIADTLRNNSMIGGETIRVSTALLPGWGVADVVGLRYKELSAVCVEHAWEMELTPGGNMTHTLERVVVNIG